MSRFKIFGYPCLFFLLSAGCTGTAHAQESTDFAGDWSLKIGKGIFLVVTITAAPDGEAHFGGTMVRLQHFSLSDSERFSNIKGPVIHYPIVQSAVKENCLSFTTQNPEDKSDEDNFRLCITGERRGTLKIDVPGFEPWPVTKEKGPLAVATNWDSTRTYYLDDGGVSSAEMLRIFQEDQKDRQGSIGKIDWTVVEKSDAARREATGKLLASGQLHTGEDFERASFVFQHGDTPDDYLLAHTLAMVAVARGQSSAIWMTAATMDRYLNSIHQPQIYGTQFWTKPKEPTTQEPYNRGLVPDALRRFLSVPSQAEQEEQRRRYDAERSQC